jgi:hypothetical protein
MTEAECEECGLWPIVVDVDGDAFTLWGPAGGEDDLLLADAGKLLAFRRWPDLVQFVVDGHPCNLLERPGYSGLREILAQPGHRVPESIKRYPFGEVRTWLSRRGSPPTRESYSVALDCLNLLWDAARTLGDAAAAASLRTGGGPLASFMDVLTFAEGHGDLINQPWPDLTARYTHVLGRLRRSWHVEA